jgi:hypothetical protein
MRFLFDGYLMGSLLERVIDAPHRGWLADFQRVPYFNPAPAYLMAI